VFDYCLALVDLDWVTTSWAATFPACGCATPVGIVPAGNVPTGNELLVKLCRGEFWIKSDEWSIELFLGCGCASVIRLLYGWVLVLGCMFLNWIEGGIMFWSWTAILGSWGTTSGLLVGGVD